VFYSARGNETEADFSVGFNPNTLRNPRFVSSLPAGVSPTPGRAARPSETGGSGGATVTEDLSRAADGLYGVRILFGGSYRLDPGETQLGTVVFDLVDGAPAIKAGLVLTNVPVAPVGPLIDGTNAAVTLAPVPLLVTPSAAPKLDFQSGLFVQRVDVGNPGVSTQAFVQISVGGLGVDSQGNAIGVRNAYGISPVTALPDFELANLAPGELRGLTAEFYVSDLVTVPTPSYAVDPVASVGSAATSSRVLQVDRAQYFVNSSYPNGAFLLEFPTEVGRRYYIQYAPSLAELNSAAATMQTARPSIPGTGSRVQWIDAGPPKTDAVPANGARFYRVILSL
jgi:hypothetical protein